MSDEPSDRRTSRRAPRGAAIRRGAPAGVLAALVLYLTLGGPLRAGSGAPTASICSGQQGAPEVLQVDPAEQSRLREDVARVIPQRAARLYEEGAVLARAAWSDEDPAPPPVSPAANRPGGYEMRWWAPNGDDVVADVFVFATESRARRFAAMAASPRCRREASRAVPAAPPHAVDLAWLNPDGVAQADVFVEKGLRVYRLADAPAGQRGGDARPGSLAHAFLTIDALACLLREVRCASVGGNAVPA